MLLTQTYIGQRINGVSDTGTIVGYYFDYDGAIYPQVKFDNYSEGLCNVDVNLCTPVEDDYVVENPINFADVKVDGCVSYRGNAAKVYNKCVSEDGTQYLIIKEFYANSAIIAFPAQCKAIVETPQYYVAHKDGLVVFG